MIEALVDADSLVYKAGYAAEHNEYLVNEVVYQDKRSATAASEANGGQRIWHHLEVEPLENALHSVKVQLIAIRTAIEKQFDTEARIRVFLTGSGNYRDHIAKIKPYKGNRPPHQKPIYFREIRQYLQDLWSAEVEHGQEADDRVAIEQTRNLEEGKLSVIVGLDKDLLQIPGWHYHGTYPDMKFGRVSEAGGLLRFYRQIITGDFSDNIGGVYRGGKAMASALLQKAHNESELWEICVAAYEQSILDHGESKCGYSDPYKAALENAQLLWLRRYEGQLWQPPSGS